LVTLIPDVGLAAVFGPVSDQAEDLLTRGSHD